MRTFSFVALALLSVPLVTASCGSSDEKHVVRDMEAGAGGEGGSGGEVAAGGSEASPAGAPQAGLTAGAPASGAGGQASGGAGGASGNQPLTLETLTGDWSATTLSTYACEAGIDAFELKIDGSNVSLPGWPYQLDGSGTIAAQGDGAFTLQLEYQPTDEFSPGGTMLGQLFVHPSAQYALLVAQDIDRTNDVKNGYFAILQRTTAPVLEATEGDFVGDWVGSNVRLDQDFATTAVLESRATFAALGLSGADEDGPFSGQITGNIGFSPPGFGLEPVVQGETAYASAFLMSPDKRALAGALLTNADGASTYGLCNQQIFADLTLHKFALWTKAE